MKRSTPASSLEVLWPGKRALARTSASPPSPTILGEAPPRWPGQRGRARRLEPAPVRSAPRPAKPSPATPSSRT